MRFQGCPGCQNFWNFVIKTNLLVCSAKIQLKLSKLPKYGQKQRFFRSFFAFFAFFQFWLNISASNCQNLIWHEIFDLLTPLTPLGARPQCLKRKLTPSDTVYSAFSAVWSYLFIYTLACCCTCSIICWRIVASDKEMMTFSPVPQHISVVSEKMDDFNHLMVLLDGLTKEHAGRHDPNLRDE